MCDARVAYPRACYFIYNIILNVRIYSTQKNNETSGQSLFVSIKSIMHFEALVSQLLVQKNMKHLINAVFFTSIFSNNLFYILKITVGLLNDLNSIEATLLADQTLMGVV
jgi:hypothetical protein